MKDDRIQIRSSKELKEMVENWAAAHGISSSKYIRLAILDAIDRENPDYPKVSPNSLTHKLRIREI